MLDVKKAKVDMIRIDRKTGEQKQVEGTKIEVRYLYRPFESLTGWVEVKCQDLERAVFMKRLALQIKINFG